MSLQHTTADGNLLTRLGIAGLRGKATGIGMGLVNDDLMAQRLKVTATSAKLAYGD